jgi:uncharacterized protein (UPF0254 family)
MNTDHARIDEVGGSMVRFVPTIAGPPLLVHRPHPEPDIHAIKYRAFGKKLQQKCEYLICRSSGEKLMSSLPDGMTKDWFVRGSVNDG